MLELATGDGSLRYEAWEDQKGISITGAHVQKMDREREPAEIKKRNVKTISDEALPKLFQQADEFAKDYSEIRELALKFGLIAAPARQSRKRKVATQE